jgi:hypothetical protein
MNASNWIIPALSTWCLTAGALAANPAPTNSNLEQRIRIQQERLAQIEQMAQQQREQVEQSHEQQRAQAPEKARELAARLTQPERLRWIEYAHMYADRPSTASWFGSLYFHYPYTEWTAWLIDAMEDEYAISEMADLLRSESFRAKLVQVVDERWEPPVLRRAARRLLDLMDSLNVELTMDARLLERNKTARLNEIAKQEKDLQEQVRTILDYLKQSAQHQPQLGVVEAVGHSPETGSYCMIEGIDRVLRPGDAVRGIRIVAVDPEKVEFAKNGTTWTQGLGAPAQPQWD